jgi:hypothetical protein
MKYHGVQVMISMISSSCHRGSLMTHFQQWPSLYVRVNVLPAIRLAIWRDVAFYSENCC